MIPRRGEKERSPAIAHDDSEQVERVVNELLIWTTLRGDSWVLVNGTTGCANGG